MKRRYLTPEQPAKSPITALCEAFAALNSAAEIEQFLTDLCTPAELESLADRWRVVPYLLSEVAYREIHDRTAVSVTTIGRVARCLNSGKGYQAAIRALKLTPSIESLVSDTVGNTPTPETKASNKKLSTQRIAQSTIEKNAAARTPRSKRSMASKSQSNASLLHRNGLHRHQP